MKRAFVALMLGSALLAAPAIAAEQAKTAGQPAKGAQATNFQRLKQMSKDGFMALRAASGARLSIFEGDTKSADTMIDDALKLLNQVAQDAKNYPLMKRKVGEKEITMHMIPVDGSLALADDFVVTKQKAAAIAKANEHFRKGNAKKAVEMLRLAAIGVSLDLVLMPLEPTQASLEKAKSLMGEQKYYQANLALKAVKDGLVVRRVALVETPKEPAKAPAKTF